MPRAKTLLAINDSLASWGEFVGFKPAKHHRLLVDTLEKAARGEKKKVILVLPTGSAKSTWSSVLFPPWYLMKYPKNGILACSHGAALAKHFGRKCRDLIEKYPEELGYQLSQTSQAADEWENSEGGYFFSAGVTGSIAGRRAHLGMIDDPVGSREQADSQIYRDKVWEWYRWDFTRRLQPNASVVIISTRWHEDDLVGRLLAKEPGEWELIHVPFTVETAEQEAIDPLGRKIGERIWPEYFTADMEKELRKDPRAWQALQQGSPSPDEGAHFTQEMLVGYNSYNDIPKDLRIYSVSDHAVRTKQMNDRTCIINFGVDSRNHIWILPDVWWKRADTLEATEQMLAVAKRHKPITWWSGRDNIRGSIGPFLRQRMLEEQIYVSLVEVVEGKDLTKRSQAIHGRCSMGMVHFPVFASWWAQAQDEILKFPRASHDDFVAALALIGMGLDQLVAAPMAEVEKEPEPFCLADVTAKWLRNQREKHSRKELAYANGL